MPFSSEQFLDVFELYNTAVFPMQLALIGLALVAILLCIRSNSGRAISAILAFLWAWMAGAYHILFFAAINPAAYLFAAFFISSLYGLGSLMVGSDFVPELTFPG